MTSLSDLQFFVRAGRAASLSEAARAVGISPAAGSALVKRLEAELGLALFVRSTRHLRLTEDGQSFLTQCEQGLDIIQTARENLLAGREQMRGTVQLSMPSDLGRNVLLPWLREFRALHPQVVLRLQLSDRVAGIHREQVDVALRYGEPADSTLVTLPVAPHNRRVLCAAPAYLKARGTPQHPQELAQHDCLCFWLGGQVHERWTFWQHGVALPVTVQGGLACDDGDAVRRLALLGEGVAYKSQLDVMVDLRAGRLVQLCPDWQGEAAPLYLACADRAQLRPVVRALRSFLLDKLAAQAALPGLS